MKQAETRKRRVQRGYGRLFKRGPGGREFPPESRVNGCYWLQYVFEGQRQRVPLHDEQGQPITDRKKAEEARLRVIGPYIAKDRVQKLKTLSAEITQAENELQTAIEQAATGIPIAGAWSEYKKSTNRPDSGEATLGQYEIQFERFADWMKENHPDKKYMRDCSAEIASQFAQHLQAEKRSPNTFNKYLNLLGLVWRVLEGPAQLTGNPWEKIQRKRLVTSSRRELTVEELRRVCNPLKGEMRILFAIGLYTGLRLGDAATLHWGEVDLGRNEIRRVPMKIARRKNNPVQIPIHPVLRAMLEETPHKNRRDYVLPGIANRYTDEKQRANLSKRIQKHFDECGIQIHKTGTGAPKEIKQLAEKRLKGKISSQRKSAEVRTKQSNPRAVVEVGFHSLRHSFVSLCRGANAPLSVVESLVGHGSPAMTRHYTHTGAAAAAAAIASLPALGQTMKPLPLPARDPLPGWAVKMIRGLTPKNCQAVKKDLLSGLPEA